MGDFEREYDKILRYEGEELFHRQMKKAARKKLFRRASRIALPSLAVLTDVMPPEGESYAGLREVPLERIIGSENRSRDFIGDFLPRRKWMESRWIKVMVYMETSDTVEPVSLIEYGGCYFVRDGNHRVSIAKARDREFITAEVQVYKTPFALSSHFSMDRLGLLKEKVRVNEETDLFSHMDDSLFDVRRKGTWMAVKEEIFTNNYQWFLRKNGREPEDTGELVRGWRKNLYDIATELMRENSLHYLFPRWGTTDIFIDFIRFWNSFPDPDALWLDEVYRLYSSRARKRRSPLLGAVQKIASWISSFFESEEHLYDRFRKATQVEEHIPDFEMPVHTKRLIRFVFRQVYGNYARHLKKKLNRAPYIHELVLSWHREYYTPLINHYQGRGCRMNFTRYYINFSKRFFEDFMEEPAVMGELLGRYCRHCTRHPAPA